MFLELIYFFLLNLHKYFNNLICSNILVPILNIKKRITFYVKLLKFILFKLIMENNNKNYISITNLFKTFQFFKHHFIIKNIFTTDLCEWFYSYRKIELNPFLLFSIPHILNLISKNYNMNFYIKYEVQDIKIISNKQTTLYSSFLQNYDFKLIIPLSKCSVELDNGDMLELNQGDVIVLTIDRNFIINDVINIISIDITGSFDVDDFPSGNFGDKWWFKYLPTMSSTCLTYVNKL